jgi:hypothetical protein
LTENGCERPFDDKINGEKGGTLRYMTSPGGGQDVHAAPDIIKTAL